MGAFSLFHLVAVLVILVVYVVPVVKILHKAGYSGWWTLLMIIPLVNIIALWCFAFAKWPALAGDGGRQ
jgi:uncharacterized membrane protein YhaH (DUF805 family)